KINKIRKTNIARSIGKLNKGYNKTSIAVPIILTITPIFVTPFQNITAINGMTSIVDVNLKAHWYVVAISLTVYANKQANIVMIATEILENTNIFLLLAFLLINV